MSTIRRTMAVGAVCTAGLLAAASAAGGPVAEHPPEIGAWLDVLRHNAAVQVALESQDQAALNSALDDVWNAMDPAEQAELGPPPLVVAHPVESDADLAASLQALPPEVLQARGIDRRLLTPEMLRANRIDDVAARKEAIVDALSSLPEDLRARFGGGFQEAGEISDGATLERTSTLIEAWHVLSTTEQDALREYEHLIDADDESGLIKAMPTMPREASDAALALLEQNRVDPAAQEALLEHDRGVAAQAATRGFYLDPANLPRADALLIRIRQARMAGGPRVEGFRTLEQQLPLYSSYMVPGAAEAYESVGVDGRARVFSDSMYGAALLVQQYPANAVSFDNPTLTIAGRDAAVDWVQYAGGDWATVVTAFDGEVVHVFEVAAKLEGSQRDDLVRFAAEVVTQSAGLDFTTDSPDGSSTAVQ